MAEAPLFDSYVMVDWSAAAVPRLGKDSIWIGHLRREQATLRQEAPFNIETRRAARDYLLELLAGSLAAGRSALVGFDFPFGYPHGFADRLRLSGPPWRAIWQLLADRVADEPTNANNRFEVAAALNQEINKQAAPFWGCPRTEVRPHLAMTRHRAHDGFGLAEKRIVETRLKGPQPVWKLYGAGAVGSQALTGIPVVHWLRNHPRLRDASTVWPFETGLSVPRRSGRAGVVFAEIYPSLVPVHTQGAEVKDSAQVRAIATHFSALDDSGCLASCFAGSPELTADQRARIEAEEGWILGVPLEDRPAPAQIQARYTYLSDPDAIYRESFAQIRRALDLSVFPEELRPLVLRLVHAAGEPALARDLVWSEGAASAGRAALAAGAPILVDAEMVRAGIIARRLPRKNAVRCFLGDRRVPALAKRRHTTRSAAAVELWRPHLAGAIVAIGNAPTALFRLLELVAAGAPKPALVLGFPVGFVGAVEAKAALAANPSGIPYVALSGRRGGSALAAASVNALAGDAP